MPYSYNFGKDIVSHEIMLHITQKPDAKVLDVGVGAGTYGRLIRDLEKEHHSFALHGLDVWQDYIDKFNLNVYYDKIFIGLCQDWDYSEYDYVIFGDVVEHLTFDDARKMLDKIKCKMLIAVPYQLPQGEFEGNPYEEHLQPDLTPDIMAQRYPEFKLMIGNFEYGYYINY